MNKQNAHIGSSLDDFLKEEDMLKEARSVAIREAIPWQVQQTMEKDIIANVEKS